MSLLNDNIVIYKKFDLFFKYNQFMDIKKKLFYIFLIIQACLWAVLQLTRNIISLDSMEAITWGELLSFGTNKHPPLSGWLMGGIYNAFGQFDILVYALGQICLFVGFIYVYKLAKEFMSEEKAFCASMILEFCFYYSYYIYVNSYNCNVVMMGLWPIVAYYFYKSVKYDRIKDWILFGLTSGLAFLDKYQIVFLFIGMFLYLIFADREQFKRKGLYLSILVGSIVILPHVIWLFRNDFFSFAYMFERAEISNSATSKFAIILNHFIYPIKFIGDQILAVLPCVGIYLILGIQARNIKIVNPFNSKDIIFLLSIGVIPIIAQGLMGAVTGSRVPGMWGTIMVSSVGILLFTFFPIEFKENTYKFFLKLAYLGLFVSLISVGFFAIFQTQHFIAFPHNTVDELNKIWEERTNSELKYVTGNMEYVFQFKFYNPKRPQVILDTFGHKNPWIEDENILKSGFIAIDKSEEMLVNRVKNTVEKFPENVEIIPEVYTMNVCNKLNRCKNSSFYYTIIPPQE